MRVLYLIGGSGRLYGSEMVALNLLKQLSDRVDFIVITSCYGDINKYCEKNKIENYVVNTSFYVYKKEENKVVDFFKHKYRLINAEFKMICAVKKIGKIIDFNTVDIIHSNLSRDLLGAKLSSIYKVPHIWYIQEMYGMKEVTNISELELYRKNTASWSITYGMTFAFPFFIAQYEEDKKRSSLFFLVVLLFFMVKCELMFALVYAICFLLYFGWEKIPNYIKVISSILIFLCAVLIIFSAKDIVYWLYITLDGKVPKLTLLRIYQLYVTLQQNSLYGNFAGRFELYFNSINSFFKHPLLGTIISNQSMYTAIGLHSQILDMLAATGIVVFIPVAYMFFYIIKRISLKIKNTNVKKRFYFLILMLILFMILNPVYYSSCIFLIIFSYPFLIGK